MTISTTSASQIVAGTGIASTYQYGFIADNASAITVTSIASNGLQTILSPTQYTLTINTPAANQLWGVGGTLTPSSVIPLGTNLLIQRTLPLTQTTSVQNQGNYYSQVTEQALDTLCMEIQQVAARTGQFRGTWATGVMYNFGDVVQDGANGANTLNYYMAAVANTSSVWATELAAGDWSLVFNVQGLNASIGSFLPLAGGTITGSLAINSNLTVTGTSNLVGATSLGSNSTAVTQAPGNNSTRVATTAFVAASVGGGGLTLLLTSDVSGVASVSFSSQYINSTYNKYVIEFDNVYSSTGADLLLTGSTNNGSTYLSSGYKYAITFQDDAGSAPNGTLGSASASNLSLTGGNTYGSTSTTGSHGTIKFSTPSASAPCGVKWDIINNQANMMLNGGGYIPGNTPINNLKIANSTGTFTGNFHLYGLQGV